MTEQSVRNGHQEPRSSGAGRPKAVQDIAWLLVGLGGGGLCAEQGVRTKTSCSVKGQAEYQVLEVPSSDSMYFGVIGQELKTE